MSDLPDNAELAPEFPSGNAASVLWKVRKAITACAKEEGFTVTGAGIGCGGENSEGNADVGLIVDGRQVEIRIDLLRIKQ